MVSILLLLPFLPFIKPAPSSPAAPWFDLVRGWHQLVDTPSVLYSGVIIACLVALLNYFGLSVTKYVSATARSLTDPCRTLAIWIASLFLGWEILMWPISLLQVVGFGLSVYGTVRGFYLTYLFAVALTSVLSCFFFSSYFTTSYNPRRSYSPLLRRWRRWRVRYICPTTPWTRRLGCPPTLARADSTSCLQKDTALLAARPDTELLPDRRMRWMSTA